MVASSLWMHKADLIVLVTFASTLLLIGLAWYSRLRSTSDYCVGTRRAGSILSILFGFGSGTNRDNSVSSISGSLQQGAPGLLWQLLWLPVIPVFWLIAPLLRRLRTRTTADFFGARFSSPIATLYSGYAVGISIVIVAATLFGGAKLIDAVVGDSLDRVSETLEWNIPLIRLVPAVHEQQSDDSSEIVPAGRVFSIQSRRIEGYEYAVLGTALVLFCYTMAGGMQSTVIASAVQGLILIVASAVLIPLILMGASPSDAGDGGLGEKFERLYSSTSGEPIGPFYIGVLCVTVLLGFIVQPHIVSVCRIGRTELQSRLGLTAGNLLGRLLIVAWVAAGLALMDQDGRETASTVPAEEQNLGYDVWSSGFVAYVPRTYSTPMPSPSENSVFFVKSLLPGRSVGALGFAVVAIMSMMMAICGPQLVVAGGMFSENLYKRVLNPGRAERHYLFMARLGTLLVLLAALVMQATFSSLITALRLVVMVPAAIGISMWFGLFWRRWNSSAVWVSVFCSLATWFVTWMYPQQLISFLPETMFQKTEYSIAMLESWQMLLYVSVGIVSGGLTAMGSQPEYGLHVDMVFTALRTPVDPDEECVMPCIVPESNLERAPVIERGMWQFPVLNRLDLLGFFLSAVAAAMIGVFAICMF